MIKKLVRRGVFETNSSSSHSLSIATEDKEFVLDTIYPDQDGTITLNGGEFGWEWFKTNETLMKANYAAQSNSYSGDHTTLIQVIKEVTGATDVIINTDDGYVDHDSIGIVPTDAESLKNFIFNKNSWLFGGNDNSTANPMFYDVPEIRDGKQIVTKYLYELGIEGIKETTKFKSTPTEDEVSAALGTVVSGHLLTSNGHFIEDDWMMRISKDADYFEESYNLPPNHETKEMYFLRSKGRSLYTLKDEYEKEIKDLDYHERKTFIRDKMLSEYPSEVKTVKFFLNEIK